MTARAIVLPVRAMTDSRQISSLFSARVIRAAVLAGVPEAPLWRVIGGRLEGDDFPPISEETHLALWEKVMGRLGDEGFPIAYARTVSIDDYGVLGLACKTAGTIAEALDVLERYLPVYGDALAVSVERRADRTALVADRPGPPTLGRRCAVESMLAEVVGSIRAISGTPLGPVEVTFAFEEPGDASAHARFFGVKPRFGARESALVFDTRALETRLVRADRALFRHLVRELDALDAERRDKHHASWAERTRIAIVKTLPRAPRLAGVARELGVSTRTLQRHLALESARFDDVADGARRELAELLLRDRRRSVSEVAALTGFAEVSSFSRAYRRWTGRSPSERYR